MALSDRAIAKQLLQNLQKHALTYTQTCERIMRARTLIVKMIIMHDYIIARSKTGQAMAWLAGGGTTALKIPLLFSFLSVNIWSMFSSWPMQEPHFAITQHLLEALTSGSLCSRAIPVAQWEKQKIPSSCGKEHAQTLHTLLHQWL